MTRRQISISMAVPLRSRSATSSNPSSVTTFSASETQIASMTAGILSRVLLHPVDCIKTRLQHIRNHSSSTEPWRAILRFIATERLSGLYRGIVGATLGVIPYSLCKSVTIGVTAFLANDFN